MNRSIAIFAAALAAMSLVLGCSEEGAKPAAGTPEKAPAKFAAAPAAKPQTSCPVMGGTVDKSLYADHDGKRVYFCCAGCIETFKKDPAKYIKKLDDAGVALAKVPTPAGK
jgi:YHS domain-containing protein